MSVTPGSFRSVSIIFHTPWAWPGTVNAASAAVGSSGAYFGSAGVDGDTLLGNSGLGEGGSHAIGSPGLLRTRLEHQPELQRNHRQPKRMHARRVRRQHQRHGVALRLVAHNHAAAFHAPPARENLR